MSYEIAIKKSALKELHSLPKIAIESVSTAIDGLAKNPRPSGCKKLKGENEIIWRVRVGNYRILYAIEDVVKIIEIRKIGHRKNIYE